MKKKLIAIAAAAVAIVPLTGSPASAAGAGAVAFSCTAHLQAFPTLSGQGTCNGTASVAGIPSAGVGGVAGSTGGQAYVLVTAPNVTGNFSARFDYEEGCVANEPPVAGAASGEATITGLSGLKGGANVTASATITFEWTRGGLTAAVVVTGGVINFSDGSSDSVAAGAALAAFVPVLTANNVCPSGGPLDALVAGTAVLGGATP
ncbi:MAG: hypothetical protein M3279_02530 [Actinomycetota bacterium]|nr:hypothetical protein [Actinomycetota bacterium]